MEKQEFSEIEKKMLDDYDAIKAEADGLVNHLGTRGVVALDFEDIKDKICSIWTKIKPFIGILENIPFVGRYISILSTLMNALCKI